MPDILDMFPVRVLIVLLFVAGGVQAADPAVLIGQIVDAQTGEPIPARIYVEDAAGNWLHPESTGGSAVRYQKRRAEKSVEIHTSLSEHPFRLVTQPGLVTITVERGKEYFSLTNKVALKPGENRVRLELRRWINMAERGWYSGDTHVHRTLDELPNLMLAEDLNVTFPLVYWVTRAYEQPTTGNKNLGGAIPDQLIKVDDTHVIWPRNTEYEIFSVGRKRHMLGAVFFLNHRSVFKIGAPPIEPVAIRARAEGSLLELDKHNWPWSMMIVPVLNVDLYELSNNHVWRTEFAFKDWSLDAPKYMGLNQQPNWTERDWLFYGFKNYYALLNCGFNLRPTAGNASGVHPVPLGFGRVYVKLEKDFDYDQWIHGLSAGRSFVTTGPMLFATIKGQDPGYRFDKVKSGQKFRIAGEVISDHPPGGVEIIRNGRVLSMIASQAERRADGSYRFRFEHEVEIEESSWVALRYLETRAGGRIRFAHSGIFHFHVEGKPLRARKEEVQFLIQRMEEQLKRSKGVLKPDAIAEYEEALAVYRRIAATAR